MTAPSSPGEVLKRATERLAAQRSAAQASAREIAEERARKADEASSEAAGADS